MHTTGILRKRVSPTGLSIALIICSGLWHVGACIYCAAGGLRGAWPAIPLFWMLTVMVTPAICFAGGMILVDARKQSPFSPMEWWGLTAIFLPVTVGTLLSVWAVKGLLAPGGMG